MGTQQGGRLLFWDMKFLSPKTQLRSARFPESQGRGGGHMLGVLGSGRPSHTHACLHPIPEQVKAASPCARCSQVCPSQ